MVSLYHSRPATEMGANRRRSIYEGNSKVLYDGPQPGTYVLYFKDQTFGETSNIVNGTGVINNRVSEMMFTRLRDIGVENHFIRRLNMREQLVQSVEPFYFSVKIYNQATEEFANRFGLEKGVLLTQPIIELHAHAPNVQPGIVGESHIRSFGWAHEDELGAIAEIARRANDFLMGQFIALHLRMSSVVLEFGRMYLADLGLDDHQLVLIDDISPDSLELFDVNQNCSLKEACETGNRSYHQEVAYRLGLFSGMMGDE